MRLNLAKRNGVQAMDGYPVVSRPRAPKEPRESLAALLGKLSEPQRNVVLARAAGKSWSEITALLGLSEAGCKQVYQQAVETCCKAEHRPIPKMW